MNFTPPPPETQPHVGPSDNLPTTPEFGARESILPDFTNVPLRELQNTTLPANTTEKVVEDDSSDEDKGDNSAGFGSAI